MTHFNQDELHVLKIFAEEHWDSFRSSALDTMSEDEFADLCAKLGLDPEE